MKKIEYKQPTIKVVKLQQAQLLAGSPKTLSGSGPDNWEELE